MTLIKDGKRVDNDPWIYLGLDDAIPAEGPIIVTLERWQRERDELAKRPQPIGLKLESGEDPKEVLDDLRHFDLIALEFPVFKNGRAYSYARLLRERYRFNGELRATGEILRDQLLFMHRCGINAFEISKEKDAAEFEAAMCELTLFYQPTGDGRQTVIDLRHDRGRNISSGVA